MCAFVIWASWKLWNENDASHSLIFINCVYTAQVVKQQGNGQANALEPSSLLVYMARASISLTAYL